jgi:hypothetical protein
MLAASRGYADAKQLHKVHHLKWLTNKALDFRHIERGWHHRPAITVNAARSVYSAACGKSYRVATSFVLANFASVSSLASEVRSTPVCRRYVYMALRKNLAELAQAWILCRRLVQ